LHTGPRRNLRREAGRYLLALGAILLAVAVRVALNPLLPEGTAPTFTTFLTVLALAWYVGPGPALLALVASDVLVATFLAPHTPGVLVEGRTIANLTIYTAMSVAGVAVMHLLHSAMRRAVSSESLLANTIDGVEGAIVVSEVIDGGADFRMVAANRACCRWTGIPLERWVGRRPSEVLPPEEAAAVCVRYRRAVEDRHSLSYEERLTFPTGTMWALTTVAPLADDSGVITRVVATSIDITERKDAERHLQQSERLYRLLSKVGELGGRRSGPVEFVKAVCAVVGEDLGVSRCGMASVDPDTREMTVFADHHGAQPSLTGVYPIGTYAAHWYEDGYAGRTVAFEDLATHPQTAPHYARVYAPIGTRAHITVPLHREGRWLAAFWVVHHEARAWTPEEIQLVQLIAERAWSVVQRKRAEEALTEADRRKDQFLAVLAHELRNPLAPVRTAAEYLKSRELPDADTRRSVKMVERQVTHMARLLDDLLDVSRVSRGVLDLRLDDVDFAEVAQSAIDACADELAGRGHALTVELPRKPVPLRADRDRLIQVFGNLLSNAAKYTPAGGRIEFRATREGDLLVVTIADNGVGIPREKLTDIFDLFVQVDRSLERQSGLGIGLTLARDLVGLHGGRLEARSDGPGRGSAFVTTLPIATAPLAAPAPRETPAFAQPSRVLVVDDNQDAAESLQMLLQRDGHDVRVAFDGRTALIMGAAFHPDVAFVDIGMPGMTGYELALRVRKEPWGAGVRLVALTGWGQDSDRQHAKEAGFDEHLVKPAAPETLREMLERRDGEAETGVRSNASNGAPKG